MSSKKLLKDFLFFVNKNPISKLLYDREIANRSKLPLTDIYHLAKHIQVFSPFTNEINPTNDWYGHAKHLKKYAGLPNEYQFKFVIEHAPYLTEQVSEAELESNLPSFITSNKYRKRILCKYKDHVFNIGPFIHYAAHFYSPEQIKLEKKRLGDNILIFPAHSLRDLIVKYDNSWFKDRIRKINKYFQSVRICLYWIDITLGLHKYYQDLGFECVTAGHILDPNFLPRLKSLIEIADLTMSNDTGTHVGYSIYMNKPHIIFHKHPDLNTNRRWKNQMHGYWSSKPYIETLQEFSRIEFNITQRQKRLARQYFGDIKDVKSKNKLREIIDLTENIYQKRHPNNSYT